MGRAHSIVGSALPGWVVAEQHSVELGSISGQRALLLTAQHPADEAFVTPTTIQ